MRAVDRTRERIVRALILGSAAMAASLVVALPAPAVKVTTFSALLHGFPALRDTGGKTLADGEFAQWIEGDRLHIELTYRFPDQRLIEEQAEFRQRPELIQEKWSWREVRDGKLFRSFIADFGSGQATAEKWEGGEHKHWSEKFEVESGQKFAGFGFVLAIMNLRERLIAGEMEGPLVEPGDPIIRIDLLPGGESEPAKPLPAKE